VRSFFKMSPQFWTGETGRGIRKAGKNCQLLAAFLCYPPQGNALGLYYLPLHHVIHEVALTLKEATDAMHKLCDIGFCSYDLESEFVWVIEKAKIEIGESLKSSDNMIEWANREYEQVPKNPFLGEFYDRYREAFHLKNRRDFEGGRDQVWTGSGHPSLRLSLSLPLRLSSLKGDRRGGEKSGAVDNSTEPQWPSPLALQKLYNDKKPDECPLSETLSPARSEKLAKYLRSFPKLEWWEHVFSNMHKSLFLRGLINSPNRNPIARGLDWLIQKGQKDEIENCVKVYEGKYDDKEMAPKVPKGWGTLRAVGDRHRQGGNKK
jgi:hypothetical protein